MGNNKESNIWAFDLGLGSIGEAVRVGTEFKHVASLLIPPDFAETKTAAGRRRMMRTRLAHKAREDWLDVVWREAGLEPLQKRRPYQDPVSKKWIPEKCQKGDARLEREFAGEGDDTCYTSCLLRIKLLRGEKLEPWQIYKALHSAIQKRGYDKDVPWKRAEAKRAGKKMEDLEKDEARAEADLAKKDPAYRTALEAWKKFKSETPVDYHFSCYYDALKMRLWNPAQPDELKSQIDHTAESTRNIRFDRADIAKEIRELATAAGKQIPALKDKADYLLYGPAEKPYASHYPELRKKYDLHLGGKDDWQGVLGQKIPRFDNRILNDCALIPRFHVCKADDPLVREVTYLQKLKNIKVERCGFQQKLTSKDLNILFGDSKPATFSFTATQWKKWCKDHSYVPLPGNEEIAAPKTNGRSRFSRPALRLVKALILSGDAPMDFYHKNKTTVGKNSDPKKGLVLADLKFIADLGDQHWENFYLPEQKLDAIEAQHTQNGILDNEAAIRVVIGSINDPIVRHRLTIFNQRLQILEKIHGTPDEVVLEFVREDFMGKKARRELSNFQKTREKERKLAREEAGQFSESKSAPLKLELLRQQVRQCLYTGEPLIEALLDDYEIEHIVPRSLGGPDAMVNYVLTTIKTNEEKGEHTPYQWLHTKNGWDAYKARIEKSPINNKKRQLLLREDAPDLVQRYTALAETAWISKLALKILSLRYNWRNGNDREGTKRITVVSGGLTARIRRKFKLNHVLNPKAATEEEAEKKNRDDKRHHALDAMVISFIPSWMRDLSKQHFFRFPEEVQKNPRGFFEKRINEVMPKNLAFEKPKFAATAYGLRFDHAGHEFIAQRTLIYKLAYTGQPQKFDLKYLEGQIESVSEPRIRKLILEVYKFIKQTSKDQQERVWLEKSKMIPLSCKSGKQGSRIIRVTQSSPRSAECVNLSKTNDHGSFYKPSGSHVGQFVTRLDGNYTVHPVYLHESKSAKRCKLKERKLIECGYFQTGCLVETTKALTKENYKLITQVIIDKKKKPRRITPEIDLPPTQFIWKTIITKDANVELAMANGDRIATHFQNLHDAGIRRLKLP